MIKKITALALCFIMLLSLTSFAATFKDVADDGSETSEAIEVLSELGVLSGMGDGTFSPYTTLTRAQVAKIAVCIMGKTKEAVATTDAFSDVKSTHWYSGYVNVVAKEGIITGYPDGSFGANDPITYAQTVTILIRLLGYNASDVGHKWPQGYLDKASLLGLSEGMSLTANDTVTRADAAVLIYRALFTDMKDTKNALITKMDKNVYEDTIILATSNENASLLVNQVQTDAGIFTFDANTCDMTKFTGCEGTVVVNDESKVIAFVENDSFTKKSYVIMAAYSEGNSDNISLVTENNGTVTINAKTTIYMNGGEYTAAKLSEGINAGSSITLFEENGAVKYAFVEEYKNQGPITVTDETRVKTIFDIENPDKTKVIRKGVSATWDDIERYDVLYYSERTNTLYVYCDRVSGMYEEAYPMKTNVTRVTVSGSEYTLTSMTAVNKLNESAGAFEIGDRVTLLLGEDGGVVDAVSLTDTDVSMYGAIVSTSMGLSEDDDAKGRTEYYVTVLHPDGREVKYTVKDDQYENEAGELCVVDFEDGYAVFSFPSDTYVTGYVNKNTRTIGDKKLAGDVKILEYISGSDSSATVVTASLADIEGFTLVKKNVKNVVYNKKGEIVLLYLDNVTGNEGIFGIVTDDPGSQDGKAIKSGTYTILSNNTRYSINGTYTSLRKGDCVEYVRDGNGATVHELTQVAQGTVIESLVDNVVILNGESYTLADNATIYAGRSSSEMKSVSWEDAEGMTGRITFFSDKAIREGGKIRVIRIYTE
ncbi:MAG: S-layer homology domain-containing protein [Clostridia bacterium]|nr:S-layer homology domain-containing protein [Clostridia bacterium]